MVASEQRLDLAAGEADVAIRAQKRPDDSGVVVRKLSDGPWALYCSQTYAARRGAPGSIEDLARHAVIGGDGPLMRLDPFQWLAQVTPEASIRSRCVNLLNMFAAIRAGHGVGALPCSQAVHEPTLIECLAMPDFGYGYYLVTNAAVKDVPRVRAFVDFIVTRASAMRHLLDGRSHRHKT
jgi:DNA-binding transcriptional LysR family regulator